MSTISWLGGRSRDSINIAATREVDVVALDAVLRRKRSVGVLRLERVLLGQHVPHNECVLLAERLVGEGAR